ncbi:MAG: acriflavin resistance protein [Isosphaeraceae bacterium]|jgi:RND family efflux transporter MFP subunit|nr:MAG: acriflavin resistance protein [Isosphaeraceae bacterium]
MSAHAHETPSVEAMPPPRSLKDELSALRIDRERKRFSGTQRSSSGVRPAPDSLEPISPRRDPLVRPRRTADAGSLGLRVLSLLLWLIPLGLIGGGSYFAYVQYSKAQPKLVVNLETVSAMTSGEAGRILTAKGYIRSFQQAKIGVKTPGRIAKLFVKEGMRVQEGDPLAELEHTELDAQLASRRLMLARSEAELAEAEVDYEFKAAKARRAERLRALNQMSIDEAEQAISAAQIAARRIESLKAAIEYQKAQIHEIEVAIADMIIRAPFSGTVTEKAAEVGETVMIGGLGGNSGRGAVVSLANLDDLEVETDIEERALGLLKDPKLYPDQPQEAEIQVLAFPEMRYRGVLDRVVPLGDRARGTVKVYVKIKNPDARLFPELVANVSFLREGSQAAAGTVQTSLYISPASVVERDGRTYAWVVDGENVAHERLIEGRRDGERFLVVSGLRANERVIVNPDLSKLRDGQPVSPAS